MPRAVTLLHDFLHDSAARLPDKCALVCAGRGSTYAELEAASNGLACALRRRGVQRGDRVVVFAENSRTAAISFWGALKADAIVSMVNAGTKAEKLAFILNDCRATALIAAPHLASTFVPAALRAPHLRAVIVDGLLPALGVESGARPPARRAIDIDAAAIVYTSGSTGEPKGVLLTHRNMLTASASITAYLENVEDDVILGVLPLSFDYGLYQLIMASQLGARLVLEKSFVFPQRVMETVVRERVTGFPGVPTLFATLAEMESLPGFDLSAVRYVTNTAAALPFKHIRKLGEIFPQARIYSMYGLTECKRCTYLPPADLLRKPGSVGIAIPNTELWLVDEQDRRLGPGKVGQLVIRGATVMAGYWEKPEATAQRLRPGPLPGERVLYTGDLCRLDDDGYLYFVARMDDIIKSRGEKVAPKEVENALVEVAGVKEAAVVGVPDARLGEAICAFVVLEKGAVLTSERLLLECRQRLEPFMVPQQIVFLRELPKTSSGKIHKAGLREQRPATEATP